MKLKEKLEDFRVEELLSLDVVHGEGLFSIYKIEKRGTNTLDVINDIAKRLRIKRKNIGYGGLKDRYSISTQYISILEGKLWRIKAKNYEMDFIGRANRPVSKSVLVGNRFTIVARNIRGYEIQRIEQRMKIISDQGFVNYYDEQRLSSARHGKGFFAHTVILEDYAKALRLLFMASSQDNSRQRRFRKCVQKNWNNWLKCLDIAPTRWERSVLEHMAAHKKGYRQALEKVDRDFLFLLGTAFQAFIWNRVARDYLRETILISNLLPQRFKLGETIYFLKELSVELFDQIKNTEIPLASMKLKLDGQLGKIYDEVLTGLGINGFEGLRSKVTGLFFKSSRRKLLVCPKRLNWQWLEDELHEGSKKLVLSVELPKGSYLTMMFRQLKPAGSFRK